MDVVQGQITYRRAVSKKLVCWYCSHTEVVLLQIWQPVKGSSAMLNSISQAQCLLQVFYDLLCSHGQMKSAFSSQQGSSNKWVEVIVKLVSLQRSLHVNLSSGPKMLSHYMHAAGMQVPLYCTASAFCNPHNPSFAWGASSGCPAQLLCVGAAGHMWQQHPGHQGPQGQPQAG